MIIIDLSTLKTFQERHNKTILFGQEKDLTKVSTLILKVPCIVTEENNTLHMKLLF